MEGDPDTALAVALIVGAIELIGLLSDKLGHCGRPAGSDRRHRPWLLLCFCVVGLFLLTRLVALGIWRFGHIEEKWSTRLIPGAEVE